MACHRCQLTGIWRHEHGAISPRILEQLVPAGHRPAPSQRRDRKHMHQHLPQTFFWDPGSFNACCTSSCCACSGLCGAPSGETCLLAFVLPTYIHSKTMSWVEEEAVVNMWTESKPVTTEYECRCIVCKVDVSDTPIFCYVRLTRGMDLMSNACRLYNSAVQIASKSSLCVL